MKYIVEIFIFLKKCIKHYYSLWVNRPINNFFTTQYKKNVLISYIVHPFRKSKDFSHTNIIETLTIAKVFEDLGYNVDIVHYSYSYKIDYEKYDIIFGFGEPLINSFYKRERDILTIYYGTGMHVCHQNHATLRRVKEVYHKKGIWIIESSRLVEKTWSVQTSLVDSMIVIGHDEVVNSYRKYYEGKIYPVPVTYYKIFDDPLYIIEHKNFSNGKKHFVWFGSGGLIHKGLDLLLEIFSKNNEWNLHICGPVDKEPKFKKVFFEELYNTCNIHTYGFVDLQSNIFKKIIRENVFVIFSSCSEGEPSSIINLMANGLIPIVHSYSGIQTKDFGITINSLTHNSIKEAIDYAVSLEPKELKERSIRCLRYTEENNSLKIFSIKMRKNLEKIIKEA